MREYLKTYEITLTAKGPVYIGSGKQFDKKEYIFGAGNEVWIIDISKLYPYIRKRGLSRQFEEYILYNGRDSLKQWLQKNRISMNDIKDCVKYPVKYGKLSVEQGAPLQIWEFVKDAYGNPYVPGSSLKGMIRTILLANDIVENQRKYGAEKQTLKYELNKFVYGKRRKFPARNIKNIEASCFNTLGRKADRETDVTNAVNDVMSGIIISDSSPLNVDDLALCQRVERKTDGTEKKMNVLRECVRPGKKITFQMTIDESLCKISAERIKHAVQVFSEMYNDCFAGKFTGIDWLSDNSVYLGGGAGFLSKTIIYPMFGEEEGLRITPMIFEKTGAPRNHKHNLDVKTGVSPHVIKCGEYNGQTLQMGLCEMKIS